MQRLSRPSSTKFQNLYDPNSFLSNFQVMEKWKKIHETEKSVAMLFSVVPRIPAVTQQNERAIKYKHVQLLHG